MQTAIDHASHHPVIAGFISIVSAIVSWLVPHAANIWTWHIPPFLMECLQSLAWVVAITAGSISIYGYFRKKFFSKKEG